jgi:flagellar motor switch protein FliG
VNEISSTGSVVGSIENTERLLARILDKEQAAAIMDEINGPEGKTVWDKLSNVSENLLATYLKNEYPQTIAVILSRIKPQSASKILRSLPDSLSSEILQRLIRMESVKKEVIEDIENNLRNEFITNTARGAKKDNFEVVAEIFNHFDRSSEVSFMHKLEKISPETAQKVKSLMFTFEDIGSFDDNAIQQLIKNIDRMRMAMALKGAEEKMRELFFKNLPSRAAKLLEEEMQMMGMVRVGDVEEAQNYLVETAKQLAADGLIFINNRGAEEGERLIG